MSTLEHADECESIDLWHHTIDDQEIEIFLLYHIKCIGSVRSNTCFISFCGEVQRNIFRDIRIIIDDQYMKHRKEKEYRKSVSFYGNNTRYCP